MAEVSVPSVGGPSVCNSRKEETVMKSVKVRSRNPDQKARAPQQSLTEQSEQNAHILALPPSGDLHNLIAKRAYEFYGERGYRDGSELDDWLNAEREIFARSLSAQQDTSGCTELRIIS